MIPAMPGISYNCSRKISSLVQAKNGQVIFHLSCISISEAGRSQEARAAREEEFVCPPKWSHSSIIFSSRKTKWGCLACFIDDLVEQQQQQWEVQKWNLRYFACKNLILPLCKGVLMIMIIYQQACKVSKGIFYKNYLRRKWCVVLTFAAQASSSSQQNIARILQDFSTVCVHYHYYPKGW